MKTLASVLLLVFTFASSTLMATDKIEVLRSNQESNRLLLKMDKTLLGGTINIIYSNGDIVTKEVLKRKKLMLDLSKVKQGDYTVIISKDGQKENFHFSKNNENQLFYRD